jgi:WD40 repeat protein
VGSESWLSLTPSTATVSSFAWSPDGEWLAVIESDRGTAITRVLAISRDGATRLDLVDTSKVQIDRDAVVRWYPDAR